MIYIYLWLSASFGFIVGFLACALLSINRENREIYWLRAALREVILESGKVDIANWPAPQHTCMSIANHALGLDINGKPKGE